MSSWMKQVCNGKTVAHCCTKKMDSDEGKTISVEQKTEIQSDIIEQNQINLKEKYDQHDIDLYESVAPKESELMVDKYNKTPFPHIPDREVSSLNKLQQQIL